MCADGYDRRFTEFGPGLIAVVVGKMVFRINDGEPGPGRGPIHRGPRCGILFDRVADLYKRFGALDEPDGKWINDVKKLDGPYRNIVMDVFDNLNGYVGGVNELIGSAREKLLDDGCLVGILDDYLALTGSGSVKELEGRLKDCPYMGGDLGGYAKAFIDMSRVADTCQSYGDLKISGRHGKKDICCFIALCVPVLAILRSVLKGAVDVRSDVWRSFDHIRGLEEAFRRHKSEGCTKEGPRGEGPPARTC